MQLLQGLPAARLARRLNLVEGPRVLSPARSEAA